MSNEDIENTIAPELRERGNILFTTSVDFTKAVKAAQKRLKRPGLVVECVAERAWQSSYSKLVSPRDIFAGERVCITCFHTFLKPAEMKNITFIRTNQNTLFDGKFYIPLRQWHKSESQTNASAGIMILGLVLTIAPKRNFWSKKNLQTVALILLLLGLVLG